jgi:hypothetical protein
LLGVETAELLFTGVETGDELEGVTGETGVELDLTGDETGVDELDDGVT